MKMRLIAFVALTYAAAACTSQPSPPAPATQTAPAAPAAATPPAGGGLAGTAEQQAKQAALEKSTPQLKVTEEVLTLSIPGQTIGEAVGVAKNAAGNLFVFTPHRQDGAGQGQRGVDAVRVRPEPEVREGVGPEQLRRRRSRTRCASTRTDNVWMVDEGSNMIVKYRPDGSVAMVLGRKEEPLDWLERFVEEGEHLEGTPPARPGVFNRPTDVTWDTEGNIFVSDGYNNSRVAKFTRTAPG